MKIYITTNNDTEIKCAVCSVRINDGDLEYILGENSYREFKFKQRTQTELEQNFSCLFCPIRECNGVLKVNHSSQNKALCQKCKIKYCLICKSQFEEIGHICEANGIEELIKTGLIMRCPRCLSLIEKIDSGCQFVKCFMCKLDICYVTRKPRWGPKGKGDTTSGCQCGMNGKKCHPECNTCH